MAVMMVLVQKLYIDGVIESASPVNGIQWLRCRPLGNGILGKRLNSKSIPARILLIVFLAIFMAGCTLDYVLPAHAPARLSIHQSGQIVHTRQLTAKDPALRAINGWLAANRDGWEYGFITRAPHILVEGENFAVNILEEEVSVKYCRGWYNCHFWIKKSSGLFLDLQNKGYLRHADYQK